MDRRAHPCAEGGAAVDPGGVRRAVAGGPENRRELGTRPAPPSLALQRALDKALADASPEQQERFNFAVEDGGLSQHLANHGDDADDSQRLSAVLEGRSRADMRVVTHLEGVLTSYRTLDDLIGPQRVLGLVKSAMAQQAYDRALARTTESGEQPLARYVLACKSEQELTQGRPSVAVVLAQEAQRGGVLLNPVVRAWAADLEARAWALQGADGECKHKLEEASELLAAGAAEDRVAEPPWAYHFVEAALVVHQGICLTDLGEADAAVDAFEGAIASVPAERVRDRSYYLSYLAKAHASNGDPERSATVARHAAQLARDTGTIRALRKLHRLQDDLRPWQNLPAVREFSDFWVSLSRGGA